MRNYIQTGDVITLTTPAGGIASGAGLQVGSLFGVASTTQIAGAPVEAQLVGVFNLPAKSGDVFAAGDKVYWDNTAKECTTTTTSNKVIGAATGLVAGGEVPVRLNGVSLA